MVFSELETVPSVIYEFPTGQSTQMGLDRFRISESLFDTSYISNLKVLNKCGALRDLVPVVQFKKREKHPWRSVFLNCIFNECFFFDVF